MSKIINKLKKKVVVLASMMLILQPLLGLAVLPASTYAEVDTPPTVPVLTSPVDAVKTNDNTPLLQWNASTDDIAVLKYYYEIDNDGDFTNGVQSSGYVDSPAIEFQVPDAWAYADGTYRWRIRATDSDQSSEWSTPFSFTVDTTIPVISLVGTDETIEKGVVYTDQGATATDTLDGDITENIIPVSTVNTSVVSTYTVTYNVSDAAGNPATEVIRTVNVVDTTGPKFNWTVLPPVAGPGVPAKIKIEVAGGEILKPMTTPPVTTSENGKEVHVLDVSACTSYDILLTVHDIDNPYKVCLNKDENGEYTHVYNIGSYVGPEKVITFSMTAQDSLENVGTDDSGIFKASNVVLSPVVETPQATLAVATVATPEPTVQNDQFGGSSEQGEVKADTTIQADNGNNGENKDDKKEDTKGKKNIPLWGIIFLLILAGIGGYLFYSQSPEKVTGKK